MTATAAPPAEADVGRDYLDSHQHVHRSEPVRSVLRDLAGQLGVPLRHFSDDVAYCGDFYGQIRDGTPYPEAISVDGLIETLSALPAGLTELACHPGLDEGLDSMYVRERATEVAALCDERVRVAVGQLGIELRSFGGR